MILALQASLEEIKNENEQRDQKIHMVETMLDDMKEETITYRESVTEEIKHLEDRSESLDLKIHETSIMILKDVDNRFETQDKEIESLLQTIMDKQSLTDDNIVKLKTDIKKSNAEWKAKTDKMEDDFNNRINVTKENLTKETSEKIKLIKYDIEEHVVNLKDENSKTNCNLRNFEGNFNTFKKDIKKTVVANMKENVDKFNENKTETNNRLELFESRFLANETCFEKYKTEVDEELKEKFCLIEKQHLDLQEITRDIF